MTVDFPSVLLGLLLLWLPRQWMRLGFIVGGHSHPAAGPHSSDLWSTPAQGDHRVRFRREFTRLRNYIDLLRGAAGGLVILGGFGLRPAITLLAGARVADWQLLAVKLGILAVGVLIQTIRYERHRFGCFAPIFYLAGLSVVLCPGWGSLFAFALIWGINPMLPGPQSFLTVYGFMVAGFGLLFQQGGRMLPLAAFLLCFLPVLLSLLARRPLVVFTRKPARTAGAGA